ncbi:MAG: TetR/AcrR family transcriptional regulator, repressor for neighboring sulfatase [Clostridiales bacterium]|nr:TetR/AcrR family transcriptional regulator, repressor for neighboring sulfatase [Clostridiales bacterium]
MKNSRQLQKENTRNVIMNTAMQQFARNGLLATKTSDIAQAAKVSHGTIFSHFPTREALLEEVIESFGIQLSARLHELADQSGSLEDVLKAHMIGISEQEDFYRCLIVESSQLSETSRNCIIMIQSAISFHMIQIVEIEKREGKIRDIEGSFLFNTWIGLIHHYLINRDLFGREGSFYERNGKDLVQKFLALIKS